MFFAASDTDGSDAVPAILVTTRPVSAATTSPTVRTSCIMPVPLPRSFASAHSARYSGPDIPTSAHPTPCMSRPANITAKFPPERQMTGTASANTTPVSRNAASRPHRSATNAENAFPGIPPSRTAATMLESCAGVKSHVSFMYGSAAAISPMSMPYKSPASPHIENRYRL